MAARRRGKKKSGRSYAWRYRGRIVACVFVEVIIICALVIMIGWNKGVKEWFEQFEQPVLKEELSCPAFHACRHFVGYGTLQGGTVVHGVRQFGINGAGQILEHFLAVENVFGEIFTGPFGWCLHRCCFLLESRFDYSES